MIAHLEATAAQFMAFTKEHPAVGFAVSAWGLAVLSWALRDIPTKVFGWIKHQSTTYLEIHNESVGTNQQSFDNFCTWLFAQPSARFSRSLMMNGGWRNEQRRNGMRVYSSCTYVGPGDGTHFFFVGRRLFWAKVTSIREGAINEIKRSIIVTTFGRKHAPLRELVDMISYKPDPERIMRHTYSSEGWQHNGAIARRPMSTVLLNNGLADEILERIREFEGSRQWYEERGISYKLSLLFHGPTGTGKTSLARALAGLLNRSIYQFNLALMTDTSLEKAVSSIPSDSILLVEDFDSASALRARKNIHKGAKSKKARPVADAPVAPYDSEQLTPAPQSDQGIGQSLADLMSPLTLSGVLNSFDGVAGLDGCIIIFSTNAIADIDETMLRPGRIDEKYLIDHLNHESIVSYIQRFAPDVAIPAGEFDSISGAQLQAILLRNLRNLDQFVAEIPMLYPQLTQEKNAA